ncbi:MAG: hypothetical protein IPJ64_09890 [Saprospiraceae bacterium]|nr:hypothetical protein [Saprospiraceae bacterium]MBK7796662.1 hypothetical protein [Saprospiraceae bacterium]
MKLKALHASAGTRCDCAGIPSAGASFQTCVSLALTSVTGLVDAVQTLGNNKIPSFLCYKMILETFKFNLTQSSCATGYNTATECNSQNCVSYKNAIYMPGCGWTLSESDYGCR